MYRINITPDHVLPLSKIPHSSHLPWSRFQTLSLQVSAQPPHTPMTLIRTLFMLYFPPPTCPCPLCPRTCLLIQLSRRGHLLTLSSLIAPFHPNPTHSPQPLSALILASWSSSSLSPEYAPCLPIQSEGSVSPRGLVCATHPGVPSARAACSPTGCSIRRC